MKKAKKIFIFLILLLSCLTINVEAENLNVTLGADITGAEYDSLACRSDSLYCYTGAGIRVSLYYYDSNTKDIEKTGNSHDIWSSLLARPGQSWTSASYHYSSLDNSNDGIKDRISNGTDWKTNGTTWNGSCTNCAEIKMKDKYAVFNKSYNQYIQSGLVETTEAFGDYTESGNSEFIKWIDTYLKEKLKTTELVNAFFQTTIAASNTQKYYITIEPIFRIWVNTNGPNGDNKKSSGYIGTVYELSKIYHYAKYSTALRSTSEKTGSFVGDVLKKTPENVAKDMPLEGNGWKVLNKKAYGVGVYKLSTYIDKTCNCTENDYKCAMNYCDANAKESERKNCVTKTCGVKDPGFATCFDDESTEGVTTSCAASTSSSKHACTIGNTNTYYRTDCTESSTVYYNDSLPTSLSPGTGFSYSVLLSGTKTCRTYFDTNKWNFDYAVSTNSNRTTLKTKLNNYKNLSKDSLDDFKYDSSDAKITIDIEEKVEKKTTTTSTKKLNHFTKVTTSDVSVSDTASTFKVMTETTASNNKLFSSSMSSIYSLPDVCIDGASGDIYDATYDALTKKYICKTTSNGPYTKFFTNLKASTTVNNTTVKITKESSSMDDLTNKCYYQVEDTPLSCVIEKNEDIYSLKIYSEYDIDYTKLRYVLSTDPNDENWSSIATSDSVLGALNAADINSDGKVDEIDSELIQEYLASLSDSLPNGTGDINGDGKINIKDATEIQKYLGENLSSLYKIQLDGSDLSQNLTIYGKIKYEGNDNMTTICSINQLQKATGKQCTVEYEPTEYDEIAKYCKSNWHTDKDNYISEKACYNACTGLNSCKVKYTCDDTVGKENFCKAQYNPVTQADSYRACINNCACSSGTAVYRPISLTNPFPNRQAGANWQGYEDNINDGSETDKAEYVIELSASDIEEINAQTEKYNTSSKDAYIDYVWDSESNTNGKYVSKFIHEDNSDLFCIIDGEGDCK